MGRIEKERRMLKEQGLSLYVIGRINSVTNRIYNKLAFGRSDIHIDYTSRILGKSSIRIGRNFHAGKMTWIEGVEEYQNIRFHPVIEIGNNVSFSDFNHVGAVNHIKIGNYVLLGSKCYITDHNHGFYSGEDVSSPDVPPIQRKLSCYDEVIIEDNVWLGDGVVVLPGVTIGKGSIIGSNAVVSKSIPPYSIAVGIPAHVIKQWDSETGTWVKVNK